MNSDNKSSIDKLEKTIANLKNKERQLRENEEKLKESEERYRKQFEEALDSIFIADARSGILIDCNKAACKLVERAKSELIGKPQRILHPLEKNKEKKLSGVFKKHLKEKEGKVLETQVITKKGEIKDVAIKANLFEFKGKKALQGIFRDITQKKKLENEYREFKFMVESAHDAIFFKDLKSRYIIANDKTLKSFGLSRNQVIGKNDYELMPDKKEAKKNIEDDQIIFRTGKPKEITKYMKGADGKTYWFNAIKVPQFDDNGNITGLVGIARDITLLKKTEELRRESEDKFKTISSSARDAVIMIDNNGNVSYWNRAAEKLFGYSSKEILGKELHKVIAPQKYIKSYNKGFKKFRITGKGAAVGKTLELNAIKKDGKEFSIELSMSSVKIKEKWSAIGIIRDITERKKAEEKLRESEYIINNSPVVAFLWKNAEGWPVEFVSSNVKDLFGYTSKELISGKVPYSNTIHPDDMTKVAKEVEDYSKDKKTKAFVQEYRIITKNKKVRWIEDQTYLRRDKKGKITHYQGIVWDITEKKKTEEELRKEKDMAEKYLDIAGTILVALDTRGDIILLNKKGYEAIGYAEGELIGKNWFMSCLPKENRAEVRKVHRRNILGHSKLIETHENPIITKKMEKRVIKWSNSLLKDGEGNIIGTLSSGVDITQRKKSEEKIKESEEKLSEILNEIAIPSFVIDKNHKVTYWNSACEIMTGCPAKKIIGTDRQWVAFYKNKRPVLADIIVKELPENRLKEQLQLHYKNKYKKSKLIKGAYEATSFFPTFGKKGKWVFFTAALLRDSYGNVIGAVETLQDVTAQKKAEENLKESEKRFQDIALSSGDWIWEIDKSGKYTFTTGITKDILGYESSEIIGKTPFDFMSKDEARRVGGIFQKIISEKKPIKDLENWNLTKEGKKVCLLTNAVPILDKKGNLISYRGVDKDITLSKQSEENLKKRTEESESFSKFAIGRELKMIELKRKIKELEKKLNKKNKG